MSDMLINIKPRMQLVSDALTVQPARQAGATGSVESSSPANREPQVQNKQQQLPVGGNDSPQAKQDKAEVNQAVERINDFVQSIQRKLNFSVDDASGHIVVKVLDADSGEIIRQMPAEVALRLARNLGDGTEGLLFKTEA